MRASADEARRDHRLGLGYALARDLHLETQRITTRWSGTEALLLAASPYPDTQTLVADAQLAAAFDLVTDLLRESAPEAIRSEEQYQALLSRARDQFEDRVYEALGGVVRSAKAYARLQEVTGTADEQDPSASKAGRAALRHANSLFANGYLTALPSAIRAHLPRYLEADARRVEVAKRSVQDAQADAEKARTLNQVQRAFEEAQARVNARPYSLPTARGLEEVRFLLEELRVSLFAQLLGTARRVSPTRLLRRIDALEQEG